MNQNSYLKIVIIYLFFVLSINAEDRNLISPKFDSSQISLYVEENQKKISIINAFSNDKISYLLRLPDAKYFFIDSKSGELSFKKALDYENDLLKKDYDIQIVARDSLGKSATLNINIVLQNIPEIKPQLEDTLCILEKKSKKMKISILNIGDSAIKNFNLVGKGSKNFKVDNLGYIHILDNKKILDDKVECYFLKAYASNSAGKSEFVNVHILNKMIK